MNAILHRPMIQHPDKPGPMPQYPPRVLKFQELCREYPYLRLLCENPSNEPRPPKPLHTKDLAPLVGSLLAEHLRPILAELLLDLLGDGIEQIILAVLRREEQ